MKDLMVFHNLFFEELKFNNARNIVGTNLYFSEKKKTCLLSTVNKDEIN